MHIQVEHRQSVFLLISFWLHRFKTILFPFSRFLSLSFNSCVFLSIPLSLSFLLARPHVISFATLVFGIFDNFLATQSIYFPLRFLFFFLLLFLMSPSMQASPSFSMLHPLCFLLLLSLLLPPWLPCCLISFFPLRSEPSFSTIPAHCGTKPGLLRHRIIHFPTSSGVCGWASCKPVDKWVQRSARALRSKQMSERCKQMDVRVAQFSRSDSWLFWTTERWLIRGRRQLPVIPQSCQ